MTSTNHPTAARSSLRSLTLAAVGVVYGDIGTSPLYTVKEIFGEHTGLLPTPDNVMGAVSLVFWGLMIVVTLKYVTLIMRADNRGEGGEMAMLALATDAVRQRRRLRGTLMLIGLAGAALFFGDSVITPAISVLSAIEGLEVATPVFSPYVVPITLVIIFGLYYTQRHGTGRIGAYFGPVMVLWFAVLATLGIVNLLRQPQILMALDPRHGAAFLQANGARAFAILGAVVLALTGAEALYTDMGHFGKKPIRMAWFILVLPALTLNYLGQGALLLVQPEAVSNPFYRQVPGWAVLPLVALSTLATVIASQATISGTFSIVKQGIQLNFLPRMRIDHTSDAEAGQIYLPLVNWLQCAAVVGAVIGFGSSSNLAGAYGIAVTGTMMISTTLTFFVIRFGWKYPLALCIAATGFFLIIDAALFIGNVPKIVHGGWFPLVIGAIMFTLMLTWRQGRSLVWRRMRADAIPLEAFLPSLFIAPPTRVPGTAVFMRNHSEGVPRAMLHNLSHNKVLHERVVFLTIHNLEVPWAPPEQRLRVTDLGSACWQVDATYGFKEQPDIQQALEACAPHGLSFEMLNTSFFLARQRVIPTYGEGLPLWREKLFAVMQHAAGDAVDYFNIPRNRVIELGGQVEI